MKPKLLEHMKVRPGEDLGDESIRRHQLVGNSVRSTPSGAGISRDHQEMDAKMHRLLISRAKRDIREGRLLLVPRSVQYDSGNEISIWSDYKPHMSLDERIREMTLEERKRVYMDFMKQLALLHGKAGVANRDMHLDNIMLWDGKRPHFTDFGMAVDLRDVGSLVATPHNIMREGIYEAIDAFGPHIPKKGIEAGYKTYKKELEKHVGLEEMRKIDLPDNSANVSWVP